LGVLTRAARNISRRKIQALLVIIALGFCMAIMISIPVGITLNQAQKKTAPRTSARKNIKHKGGRN
jgi:hypothetical protein